MIACSRRTRLLVLGVCAMWATALYGLMMRNAESLAADGFGPPALYSPFAGAAIAWVAFLLFAIAGRKPLGDATGAGGRVWDHPVLLVLIGVLATAEYLRWTKTPWVSVFSPTLVLGYLGYAMGCLGYTCRCARRGDGADDSEDTGSAEQSEAPG